MQLIQEWQESVFHARTANHIREKTLAKKTGFPILFKKGAGAILEKDIISFARNYQQISRAGFVLFLLVIYLAAIVSAGKRIGGLAEAEGIVLALHLIAISYFATTLALQFVFPSISLEGRGAWILWSSPINRKKIILGKFLIFSAILFAIMEMLLLATASSLELSSLSLLISSIMLFLMVLAITAVALGLGTIFPNFHESNVDRLSTSTGGLCTTFIGLLYGLFMGFANFKILELKYGLLFWSWFLAAIAVSFLLIISFIYIASRKIQRLEVV